MKETSDLICCITKFIIKMSKKELKMTKSNLILRNVAMIACLAVAVMLSGCKNSDDKKDDGNGNDGCGTMSVTMSSMKQAAKASGHFDNDQYVWQEDDGLVGGFQAEFDVNSTTTVSMPVLEFKDKASADAVAKRERDAKYNYPIQNCKFLTFATGNSEGVIQYENEKAFLEKLINGQPLN